MSYVIAVLNKRTGSLVERDERAPLPIVLDSLPVIFTDSLWVRRPIPQLILEGTESGAKKFIAKEDSGKYVVRNESDGVDELVIDPASRVTMRLNLTAGGVALDSHASRHAYNGADPLPSGSITKSMLVPDTIRLEIPVPLGYIPTGLATDSTGVKFESKRYLISSDLLSCAKAAYFETDLQQLTGGTVAIELYDYTAAAVITSISLSATTKRARSGDILASLKAGNEVGVRFNVTTAGASGSVGGGCSPVLIIVIGIS